jgi:hypothetical protein
MATKKPPDFYQRNGDRFRRIDPSELERPGMAPWMGIEFTELGGLSVSKLYATDGDHTFEIYKKPPMGGGPYLWQIIQEITAENNPFLDGLIREKFNEL